MLKAADSIIQDREVLPIYLTRMLQDYCGVFILCRKKYLLTVIPFWQAQMTGIFTVLQKLIRNEFKITVANEGVG